MVIMVSVAIVIGLSLEGFSIIFREDSIISRFELQRDVKDGIDLDQPLTRKDLFKILEEMDNIKSAINIHTPMIDDSDACKRTSK